MHDVFAVVQSMSLCCKGTLEPFPCPGKWLRHITPNIYSFLQHYLRGYLQREFDEHQGKLGEGEVRFDFHSLAATVRDTVPQQDNGVDCGVFVIENVRRLIAGTAHPADRNNWCDQVQAKQGAYTEH